MRIVIGSDVSGFELKESVKRDLEAKGYCVADVGTLDPKEPVDFFVVGARVGRRISEGEFQRGIVCCGNGMGVGTVAGKFPGVTSCVCETLCAAMRCRVINNANVLAMGGQMVAPFTGVLMANAFLTTDFCEGLDAQDARYLTNSLDEIRNIEASLGLKRSIPNTRQAPSVHN